MLRRFFGSALAAAAMLLPASATAQYNSEVVGFNGPPIDNPATSQEMFLAPQASGSTDQFVILNTVGQLDQNASYRAAGLQTEGLAALEAFWHWVDPYDPFSWLRLTTFNGPTRPNPALHVQGKVRFKVTNRSDSIFNLGTVGVCLGIRETGVDVNMLANGGFSGAIEWVGVSNTPNGITAGADGIVDTIAAGDDFQVYVIGTDIGAMGLDLGTAAITPGANGAIDTVPAGDDQLRRGFVIGQTGERVPVPAVSLPPSPVAYVMEWDLATGSVTVDGTPITATMAGFTGNGLFDVSPAFGVLEHIAFTSSGDGAGIIDVGIDELQFESPVPDDVVKPTVNAPIITGDATVTVSGLVPTVNRVTLYRNNVQEGAPQDVASNAPVVFTLGSQAVTGDVFTATQRDGSSGLTSPPSDPVTVYPFPPPAAPTSVMVPLETGQVTVSVRGIPAGVDTIRIYSGNTIIGTAPVTGQTQLAVPVTPLVHLDQISATVGITDPSVFVESAHTGMKEVGRGNGDLYLTLGIREAVIPDGTPIGTNGGSSAAAIEWVGATGTVNGAPTGKTLATSTSWQTVTFDPATDPIRGFTGDGILSTANGLGIMEHLAVSVIGGSSGRSTGAYLIYVDNVVNVQGNPDGSDATITDFENLNTGVQALFRAPNLSGSTAAHLETTTNGGPNVSTVTTDFGNPNKSCKLSWCFISSEGRRWIRLTTSGTANVGNPVINLTKPIRMDVLIVPQLPQSPVVLAPVEDGDTIVQVTNLSPLATNVTVYANGAPIASVDPAGAPSASITVPRLNRFQSITAKQTLPSGTSPNSLPLEVGNGNGDIMVCIGVRETGDTGPLGSQGSGTVGGIEWIGASSVASGAPQGIPVAPDANWHTYTFDPIAGPVQNFAGGNGVIDSPNGFGTLEHLAITIDSASADRSSGQYTIYVDNVVNVGADVGGADFVVADFETFALGDEVLFQEPTFSGSTGDNLAPTPSHNQVSNAQGNPSQSGELVMFFRDTSPGRWVRITTSGAVNTSRPIVDLTRPIRLDMLVLGGGNRPGDVDGDGDVDITDLALLLSSFGSTTGQPTYNPNADFDGDGDVDLSDLTVLLSNFGT